MIYVGLAFLGLALLFPFLNSVLRRTYTVPVTDFASQLPARIHFRCFDKKGQLHQLYVSPAIEVKFIFDNGRKTIFYLDTITLAGDNLSGNYSRFLNLRKTISLAAIRKIRLQDGGKRFIEYAKKARD